MVTLDVLAMGGSALFASAILAFMKPSLLLAGSRLAILGCLPYLYSRHQLNAQHTEHLALALATRLRPVDKPPVTHWNGRLTIRMLTDDATYSTRAAAPVLYDKFMNSRRGLQTEPVRYRTFGMDETDAKYEPVVGSLLAHSHHVIVW